MDPIAIGAIQEEAIGEGDEEGAEVGVVVEVVEDTIGTIIGKDPIVWMLHLRAQIILMQVSMVGTS